MAFVEFLKRVATFTGRTVEFALTGQTEYSVITSELADFKCVTDLPKGKRLLADTRAWMRTELKIELQQPVLLELFSGKDFTAPSLRYVMRGTVGSYQPHPLGERGTHLIHVLIGLPRGRFKAIVAHELTHAYQREAGILITDRTLREGFARWVEYKVLRREGEAAEAEKLVRVRRLSAGRRVKELLEMEKSGGTASVLDYVHRIP